MSRTQRDHSQRRHRKRATVFLCFHSPAHVPVSLASTAPLQPRGLIIAPMSFNVSASAAAQSASEHVQIAPSSDQSNEAADGLSALALAGHDANSADGIALPGIGLPLSQHSALPTEGRCGYWYEHALPVTVRERVMMAIMATLKDKPDWERKVFDDLIVGRWRAEALTASSAMQAQDQTSETATTEDEQTQPSEAADPTSDYNAPVRQRVVTERLFQYVSLNGAHISYTN